MKSITQTINDVHSDNNSTFGSNDIGCIPGGSLTPSINISTAFAFRSFEELEEYYLNERNNIRYARDSNRLVRQAERYFSEICSQKEAFLFNSGMAAVGSALSVMSTQIDKLVTFGVCYRKTEAVIDDICQFRGVQHIQFDSLSELVEADIECGLDTLFFVENFSNPFLRYINISELRDRFPESKIVLDFTLQSLANKDSDIECADISVVSLTKYIGGHNDVLGGLAVSNSEEFSSEIWKHRSRSGSILGANETYLVLRSLRTYDMRIERINQNVKEVLNYLGAHKNISQIFYPGQYENSHQAAELDGLEFGGGVVSFVTNDNVNAGLSIPKLRSIKMAPSFGSVDSLIEIPATMSARKSPSDECIRKDENLLFQRNFIRLSVGCEPINYIIQDLESFLEG